ncbi:zinc ABC transporter substrate-binding protein [Staphylococcus arlettae]|uniref:metal ABC transporter solute-binding protein, Zn/Mn family n=1 Tax=Staphylococcus arlettae TaxID=29378 RepID=UPI001E3B0997|nr:zinc ABC transporter substrate-binding protein [Staphylococcus arlettae]
MKKTLLIIAVIVFSVTLTACNQNTKQQYKVSTSNKLEIYTTVFAFQSFAKDIGGKYVNVQSLYPPGADTHSYEPTQRNMIDIAKSDLFIYSSEDMDPVAKKIASSITNEQLKLPVADAINHEELLATGDHNHEHGDEHKHEHEEEAGKDPHVWLDPKLNKQFTKAIKDELVAKDPKHSAYYEKNYRKLNKDIDQIDRQLKTITTNPKRDTVIISHDSIGYLARRYNFNQVGVTGMNNEDPSQQELMEIIKHVKETQQPYLLYEQNISSKITDVIKKETNTTPVPFNNLTTLAPEDKDNNDVSYQSIMHQNIDSLDKALNN